MMKEKELIVNERMIIKSLVEVFIYGKTLRWASVNQNIQEITKSFRVRLSLVWNTCKSTSVIFGEADWFLVVFI